MTASAYCYTDCLNQRGMRGLPRTLPTIVGHAAVGIVEHAGPAITRVREGNRVLVPGTPECEVCFWCRKGRPDQCEHLLAPARPVAHRADGTPVITGIGTYAELITIRGTWAFPLDSALPDTTLTLLGCGITTGVGAAFNVGQVQILFGSIDVLPNGHVLVPENLNNRVAEYNPEGRVVWEATFEAPVAATRLPTGHTLVTSMNPQRGAVELDRAGKECWQYRADTRVTRAFRR